MKNGREVGKPQVSRGRQVLLAGKVDDRAILEAEIVEGRVPQKLQRLVNELDLQTLQKLTELAIEYENLEALMILARSRIFAVAQPICTADGVRLISDKASEGSKIPVEMWYLLRGVSAAAKQRPIFKRLAAQSILRSSGRIHGKGLRGETVHHVPYIPEQITEFDEYATLEKVLEKGIFSTITYKDIVGIERMEKKKVGALMLDTSGSMYGDKLTNAALATAVLAHHMRNDDYAVVVFNTKAKTLKKLDEQVNVYTLVDRVLEMEAAGFTNIRDALEKGLKELNKSKEKHRWGILISDGNYNRGGEPFPVARRFPKLHVIATPNPYPAYALQWYPHNVHPQGRHIAKRLTQLGRGRYREVQSYSQIPRVLLQLLAKI